MVSVPPNTGESYRTTGLVLVFPIAALNVRMHNWDSPSSCSPPTPAASFIPAIAICKIYGRGVVADHGISTSRRVSGLGHPVQCGAQRKKRRR